MSRAFCYNVFETLMESVINKDIDTMVEMLNKTRACDAYTRFTYFRVIINDELNLKSHLDFIKTQAQRGMAMTKHK
jgi:hypothetical protein